MYREKQPGLRHFNILFDGGGLGDAIARLPAVRYIIDNHPHIYVNLWVPDYFKEYAKNCLGKRKAIIRSYSEKSKYNEKLLARCFSIHKYDNMAAHITDNAFHVLVNKDVIDSEKNYLKPDLSKVNINKFNLPKRYIVLTTGYTAPVREMLPAYINQLIFYIKQKGYEVVFLGKTETFVGEVAAIQGNFKEEINFNKGINLIDKTNLLETTKIIAGANSIVGLDNGLLHLAGCTDIPIVGGFTTVEPMYRMPYRYNQLGWNYYPVTPSEELKCRFCQSNWSFTYDNDFRFCYYGPDDYQCIKILTADLYIKELEKIL